MRHGIFGQQRDQPARADILFHDEFRQQCHPHAIQRHAVQQIAIIRRQNRLDLLVNRFAIALKGSEIARAQIGVMQAFMVLQIGGQKRQAELFDIIRRCHQHDLALMQTPRVKR